MPFIHPITLLFQEGKLGNIMKSLNMSVKIKRRFNIRFKTKQQVKDAVEAYIRFCNTRKIHSYNDYLTSVEKGLNRWKEMLMNYSTVSDWVSTSLFGTLLITSG